MSEFPEYKPSKLRGGLVNITGNIYVNPNDIVSIGNIDGTAAVIFRGQSEETRYDISASVFVQALALNQTSDGDKAAQLEKDLEYYKKYVEDLELYIRNLKTRIVE